MKQTIDTNLEFVDVLNAFPFLKEKLDELDIDYSDLRDGETVIDFLSNKLHNTEEINITLRQLNLNLKNYYKDEKSEETEIAESSNASEEVYNVNSEEEDNKIKEEEE